MNKGLFISFEGGEGAGKSSVITLLTTALIEQGHKVIVTREPGGIPIAEKIREVILDREHTAMDARTEALLYAAARRQHLVEKVIPALEQGYIVICDRFIDSSLAYQGVARGLGIDEIWSINQFAIEHLMPQLTIYMDVTPEVGLARIAVAAGREINRLDLESNSFHDKVRAGYLTLCERYSDRIIKVDANVSQQDVYRNIFNIVSAFIEGK
ncbi:MAG TPA: dTMP kinase [Candidatus Paenibacillus intestinavium]|nr:dTMP kinase [Candidatus Paenibacillus intestinavium]